MTVSLTIFVAAGEHGVRVVGGGVLVASSFEADVVGLAFFMVGSLVPVEWFSPTIFVVTFILRGQMFLILEAVDGTMRRSFARSTGYRRLIFKVAGMN